MPTEKNGGFHSPDFMCFLLSIKMLFRYFSVQIMETKKKSETALTGFETLDVSFARLSSRFNLLIAKKLISDI